VFVVCKHYSVSCPLEHLAVVTFLLLDEEGANEHFCRLVHEAWINEGFRVNYVLHLKNFYMIK
jgi:hypothetical protein